MKNKYIKVFTDWKVKKGQLVSGKDVTIPIEAEIINAGNLGMLRDNRPLIRANVVIKNIKKI